MKEETFTINGTDYVMRKAPFMKAKSMAMTALSLLRGGIKNDGNGFDIDIGVIASNLSSPTMADIEKFILDQTYIQGIGKLSDPRIVDEHFSEHPEDYFLVIFEGVKYHFLPLLPVGKEFVQSMSLDKLKEMAQQ